MEIVHIYHIELFKNNTWLGVIEKQGPLRHTRPLRVSDCPSSGAEVYVVNEYKNHFSITAFNQPCTPQRKDTTIRTQKDSSG